MRVRYGQIIKSFARFGVVIGYDPHDQLAVWPASRVPYALQQRLKRLRMGLNKQIEACGLALEASNGRADLPSLPQHLHQFVQAAAHDDFPIIPLEVGTRSIHDLNVFVVSWLFAYATSYRRGEALEQLNLAHQVWLELEVRLKEIPGREEA